MTKSLPAAVSTAPALANPHLLGAALAGLLCLAGCSIKDAAEPSGSPNAAGETNQAAGAGGTETAGTHAGGSVSSGGDSGGDASSAGGVAAGGVAAGGAADGAGAPGASGSTAGGAAGASGAGGAGGAAPELPHITSSENVGVMTEEQFKALCDARGGTVEVMPHCGGFATAKGFSYDSTTELLSEHTCHGANTCTGWNCAIPD
jgi:hypothetical protein